jgi:hypothetical protein
VERCNVNTGSTAPRKSGAKKSRSSEIYKSKAIQLFLDSWTKMAGNHARSLAKYRTYSRAQEFQELATSPQEKSHNRLKGYGSDKSVHFQGLPADYDKAMVEMKKATHAAMADGHMLLEIEFPTAGLFSVAGDAEGQNEMTYSLEFLRQYLSLFQTGPGAQATRVFFPDKKVCNL